MRIVISGLNTNNQEMFYVGDSEVKAEKGLGSGALTGTNKIPYFRNNIEVAKEIKTFIDAKRIMSEIIDSIRYKDIKNIKMISIHILEG